MDAKQTPLVDLLRLHAEDLHSAHGHNQSSRLLSQAADEIDRLKLNLVALEDEKNSYIDYVGDALGQDHDGETLWDAAQRVLSERDRLRAELAECRKDAERYRLLRNHISWYDVDHDFDVEARNVPVLASVSAYVWYHATDVKGETLDDVVDALAAEEKT